jgi:LPS export ABC transporter protein LptC
MINKIRALLLILIIGVAGLSGYFILQKLPTPSGNLKIKMMASGIDVEIENFKLDNVGKDGKNWELKADLAQIDNKNKLTHLTNIELWIDSGDDQGFHITSDSGTLKNGNEDVDLEGHVKLVGQPKQLFKRFKKPEKQ